MWSILSTDFLPFELRAKVLVENLLRSANLTADFAAELLTAMSIGGRLSYLSSPAVEVFLSAVL